MQKIIVIGHKNPDTDSIVAAMVLADFLNKKKMPAVAARIGDINSETKYILKKAKLKPPVFLADAAGKDIFLVDHSELAQSARGIERAKIVGVLDHHHIGGLSTNEPIYFRNEALGSASTLICKIFEENKIKIDKKNAFLLLSAIIVDTLKFTSPTSVKEDEILAKKLAKIAGVEINGLAKDIFQAKSSLKGFSIEKILKNDYKEFNFSSHKIGIGVFETVDPKTFNEKQSEILTVLPELKKKNGVEMMFFAVIDIIKKGAYFYLTDEAEKKALVEIFKGTVKNNIMFVPGIVSRKKEMVPVMEKYFGK